MAGTLTPGTRVEGGQGSSFWLPSRGKRKHTLTLVLLLPPALHSIYPKCIEPSCSLCTLRLASTTMSPRLAAGIPRTVAVDATGGGRVSRFCRHCGTAADRRRSASGTRWCSGREHECAREGGGGGGRSVALSRSGEVRGWWVLHVSGQGWGARLATSRPGVIDVAGGVGGEFFLSIFRSSALFVVVAMSVDGGHMVLGSWAARGWPYVRLP